jgi:proteic killer suppression protein
VIKSFRHAGIEKFFVAGSKAGIQPAHAKRLRLQLARLHVAVNGNWSLTFAFEGEDAILVDYQDYH